MGVLVGSVIGGFIPEIWGASALSFSSLLFGVVGAFVGLWLGFRLSQ